MRKKKNKQFRKYIDGIINKLKGFWIYKTNFFLRIILGILILMIGVIMIPLPGPGWPIVFFALSIFYGIKRFKKTFLKWFNYLNYYYLKICRYFMKNSKNIKL